jgi:outer membrane lipoprotein carrier protein
MNAILIPTLVLAIFIPSRSSAAASTAAVSAIPLQEPTTGPITVPVVMERFESFDRGMRSLSASFRQIVHSQDTGQSQSAAGTFDYRKKNLMRIEHSRPERQTLVSDGAKVWVWRPANGQVIRSGLEAWKQSQPLAQGLLDFGNYAELLRRYDVSITTVSAPDARGYRQLALELRPRPTPGQAAADAYTLTMRLSTKDFFPYETDLRAGGVTVRTVFSDVRYNPALPDSLFRFSPPAGADVLDFPAKAR